MFSRTGDYQETPDHNHWAPGVLRVCFSEFQATRKRVGVYQTVEEQRRYASHDADDGERNTEVLKNRP